MAEPGTSVEVLDEEWIELLSLARRMGIPLEQIKAFLQANRQS